MSERRELPISPQLAELLDEFLRNRELPVIEMLTDFLATRGSTHPRFDASNLIDELSFAVHRFRHHAD